MAHGTFTHELAIRGRAAAEGGPAREGDQDGGIAAAGAMAAVGSERVEESGSREERLGRAAVADEFADEASEWEGASAGEFAGSERESAGAAEGTAWVATVGGGGERAAANRGGAGGVGESRVPVGRVTNNRQVEGVSDRGADRGGLVVADVMGRAAPVAPSHLPVWAVRKIAALKKSGVVFLEAEGRLLGVVDAQRLSRAADEEPAARHMRPLFFSVRPTTTLARVRELLVRQKVACLPVAVGVFLVGTISRADVERALSKRPPRATAAAARNPIAAKAAFPSGRVAA